MYKFVIVLFLTGCWTPVDETVALSSKADFVEIAEWTADRLDAPQACRNWDEIGIYAASSPLDFYLVSGYCPSGNNGESETVELNGQVICSEELTPNSAYLAMSYTGINSEPSGERWDLGAIVFVSRQIYSYVVAHEVAHLLLTCMNGGIADPYDNLDHSNQIFKEAVYLLRYSLLDGGNSPFPMYVEM